MPDSPEVDKTATKENEQKFDKWYGDWAKQSGMNPNPDDPRHFYDYRTAFKDGVTPPTKGGHWPSKYKIHGNPRMFVDGKHTQTGKPATEEEIVANQAQFEKVMKKMHDEEILKFTQGAK
jgi:hypothetical protein